MKKVLFISVFCLLATITKAQVNNVLVTNNTPCTIYLKFFGDVTPNGCNATYSSHMKWISGGTSTFTVNGSTTAITGSGGYLTATDEIVGVEIYDGQSGFCGTGTLLATIGESCYSPNTVYGTYSCPNFNTGCSLCGPITATWTNIGGGTATLDFN